MVLMMGAITGMTYGRRSEIDNIIASLHGYECHSKPLSCTQLPLGKNSKDQAENKPGSNLCDTRPKAPEID
jgi:hypothetical protein